jgi:hypothetical protein
MLGEIQQTERAAMIDIWSGLVVPDIWRPTLLCVLVRAAPAIKRYLHNR